MIIAKPVIIRVTQPTRKESVSVLDLEVGVVMRGICVVWSWAVWMDSSS
jgi:hypothetical protein